MNIRQLSEQHLDSLREAGNIGSGNAVTALSILLEKAGDMNVAQVRIRHINELGNVLGNEENYIAAMLIEVHGDLNAMLILALETESAEQLVNTVLKDETPITYLTELQRSALCETGNILAGSYLGALATLTNLELMPSVPQMALDMAGAILSFPAIEFVNDDNNMMFIETYFTDQERLLNGTYILVLDEMSFEKIVGTLDAML